MNTYNPDVAPDASAWLALGEDQRIELVSAFHDARDSEEPGARMHVVMHCVVETQIAEGLEPAIRVLQRAKQEGLGRHQGIHAVVSVLTEHLQKIMHSDAVADAAALNRRYAAELARLDLKRWKKRLGAR
jgi:hypothetical protein